MKEKPEEDLTPIPEFTTIYTVDEFTNMCKSGYVSSYDGVGFLATDAQQSRVGGISCHGQGVHEGASTIHPCSMV